MKFARGHKKVGGRQIGTPNKLSLSAKEAFQHAFEANGGVERFMLTSRLRAACDRYGP
jgi:hypothetical protein